jgi:hypothetical protein
MQARHGTRGAAALFFDLWLAGPSRSLRMQGRRCPALRRRTARADLADVNRDHQHPRRCRRCLVEDQAAAVRRQARVLRHPFIETYLRDADEQHSAAAEAVGGGVMFALAAGKGIVAHPRGGERSSHVRRAGPPRRADRQHRLHRRRRAATARFAAEFDGWEPELTALITEGEIAPIPRPKTGPTHHDPQARQPTTPHVRITGLAVSTSACPAGPEVSTSLVAARTDHLDLHPVRPQLPSRRSRAERRFAVGAISSVVTKVKLR